MRLLRNPLRGQNIALHNAQASPPCCRRHSAAKSVLCQYYRAWEQTNEISHSTSPIFLGYELINYKFY